MIKGDQRNLRTKMARLNQSLLVILGAFQLHRCYAFSSWSRMVPTTTSRNYFQTTVWMTQSESSPRNINFVNRRQAIVVGGSLFTGHVLGNKEANAEITDERGSFGVSDLDNSYGALSSPPQGGKRRVVPDDEITVVVSREDMAQNGLGIQLGMVEFRTNSRVVVKSVRPNSLASRLGIKESWVLVSVDGENAERTNAEGVTIILKRAQGDTIELKFRDPDLFRQKLISGDIQNGVTTEVAPAGDTTQRNADGSVKLGRVETQQEDQQLTVSQLVAPKLCRRGATTDDLLEISYIGKVVETDKIFDGSAIMIDGRGVQGRGNDVSLFFVLGKQPFGQFPPGWDVGLEGMCVGERRRLIIPPVLAYGDKGVPRRGIPPNSTLQYDISLVSINGLATPQ